MTSSLASSACSQSSSAAAGVETQHRGEVQRIDRGAEHRCCPEQRLDRRTRAADARLDGAAQRVGHAIIAAPKSAQYLDHEQRVAARALQDVSGERTLPGLAG